jgi:hypothetical protein
MRFSAKDLSHGWSRMKGHIGHAWVTGNKALVTADRYMSVASRLFDATQGMMPSSAKAIGVRALSSYASGRGQIDDFKRKTEGTYQKVRSAAPELF